MKELKLPSCWVVFYRAHRAKKWLPSKVRVTAAAGRAALWDQVNNGESGHHLLMRVAGWKVEPMDLPAPPKAKAKPQRPRQQPKPRRAPKTKSSPRASGT